MISNELYELIVKARAETVDPHDEFRCKPGDIPEPPLRFDQEPRLAFPGWKDVEELKKEQGAKKS